MAWENGRHGGYFTQAKTAVQPLSDLDPHLAEIMTWKATGRTRVCASRCAKGQLGGPSLTRLSKPRYSAPSQGLEKGVCVGLQLLHKSCRLPKHFDYPSNIHGRAAFRRAGTFSWSNTYSAPWNDYHWKEWSALSSDLTDPKRLICN